MLTSSNPISPLPSNDTDTPTTAILEEQSPASLDDSSSLEPLSDESKAEKGT